MEQLRALNRSRPSTLSDGGVSERTSRVSFWVSAVLLAALHVSLVNYFVPIESVFSNEPIHGIDYDLHIGQVYRVVDALDRWGKTWLYDVQLLAGQPEGTITDSGSKGWELWTFGLVRIGVSREVAFNSFVLLSMCSGPLLIFMAARAFELSAGASLLAAAMTSTLWFFDSHLHWVWFVGMISWCLGACLALLEIGLFQRWLRSRKTKDALLSGVLLGVTLLVHPYTFFAMSIPMAATYLRAAKGMRLREHIAVVAMALFAIGLNGFWLHNALTHWHYILDSAVYAQAAPEFLACDVFDVLCSGSDTGIIGTRTGFRFLYFALGVAGLWAWHRHGDPRWLPVMSGLVLLIGVAYFGGFVPGMQQTQPYRHITPGMLLATLPAADFLARSAPSQAFASSTRPWRLFLIACAVVVLQQLVVTQVLYFFPALLPEPSSSADYVSRHGFPWRSKFPSQPLYRVPHPDDLEHEARSVIQWLDQHVPSGARILVEAPVMGERLAAEGRLEVLGGFFERNVEHVDANYFRAHRGKRVDADDFARYLTTFAVEWVVKENDEFDSLPELQRVAVIADRYIYRTLIGANRVRQGGGYIRASQNRIEVHGSEPHTPLVLAYHWHEALRCTPDCRVERQHVGIDRVGFVRVPAPHPADLVVWNSYETR